MLGEEASMCNRGFKVKGLEPGIILRPSQEPNPFLLPTMEVETLIRNASPPLSREQGRLSGSSRGGGPLSLDTFPFDEALRDITAARPSSTGGPAPRPPDPVTYHGQQFLEIKMTERKGEECGPGSGEGKFCEDQTVTERRSATKATTDAFHPQSWSAR